MRLTVSTTTDTDVVNSPSFAIVPAGQLSEVTLDNADRRRPAAGARTRYVATFKLSATGGLTRRRPTAALP